MIQKYEGLKDVEALEELHKGVKNALNSSYEHLILSKGVNEGTLKEISRELDYVSSRHIDEMKSLHESYDKGSRITDALNVLAGAEKEIFYLISKKRQPIVPSA